MIKGFIRAGSDRETLFGEGMKNADVLKCTASFGLNEVDSAELTVPATNRPARSMLQKNAIVELRDDSETVFVGDVATVRRNELGDVVFELDGALGWMRCVCKAPFTIKPTDPNGPVQNFLTAIFAQYNAAVPEERRLQLGSVTVAGGVSMDHSGEYVTMLDLLREVREQRGGYLYVSYTTSVPTVHYVAALSEVSVQTLEFGANVLTVEDQLDFSDYASRVYATGTYYVTTTVDGQEKREQKPVDAGYVSDADAEALYGRTDLAYQSSTDMGGDKDSGVPDKTQAEAREIILAEAQAILNERKTPLRSLEMTAVELAEIGADYRLFKVGTVARALVQILNIDTTLAVRRVKRDFIDAGNTIVSFGREAATISGASFGGGGSVSGSGSGQVGPQGPAGPQGPQGPTGPQGPAGADGEDGVSPIVTVTEITGGHRITITDAIGTSTFDVMDGDDSSATAAMTKTNGAWQLNSSGMWRTLWNHYTDEILLITADGANVRHLYKVGVEYTDSSSVTSVDLYFSDQRYNGRSAEGKAFKITVPETGTGTITEITAADIPTGGGNSGDGLPAIEEGDAFKKLRVKYDESGAEWATDEPCHRIFFFNEATGAVTKFEGGAATGADISESLNTLYYSTYIIGFSRDSSTNDVTWNYYLPMDDFAPSRVGLETVRFYRQTTTGIEVLSLDTSTSTATKTVVPSSSGSGNFVKITYNSNTTDVTHNGAAITGAQIKALIDRQDGGAIMVDTYMSPNAVYKLKNIYSNGDVEFEGEFDGNTMNVVIAAASSSGTLTIKPGTDPLIIPITYDGTTYTTTATAWQIYNWRDNCEISYSGKVRMTSYGATGPWTFLYFCRVNVESSGDADLDVFEVDVNTDTGDVIVTRRRTTLKKNLGLTFQYDATRQRVVSIKTGSDVTGNDIAALMDEHGVQPMIFYNYRYYHLYSQDSGGPYFRTVDNTREIWMNWASYNAGARNVT